MKTNSACGKTMTSPLSVLGLLLVLVLITSAAPADAAEPEKITLSFSDAYLVYTPGTDAVGIHADGFVLSYGEGWEAAMMTPRRYHMRMIGWSDFFWLVDVDHGVFRVTDGTFGSPGGENHLVGEIDIEVFGGGPNAAPDYFQLHFDESNMIFFPITGIFQIAGDGFVLSRGKEFEIATVSAALKKQEFGSIYQIRRTFWNDFFWSVFPNQEKIYEVTNGTFGVKGGDAVEITDITVNVTP